MKNTPNYGRIAHKRLPCMNSMHAFFGTNDFIYIYVVLTLYLKEAHLFTFQNGRTCFHRLLRARANERLYVMQLEIFLAINFSVKCAMCDVRCV